MRLATWCKLAGISRQTAWRWRNQGKLQVVFYYGRAYVPASFTATMNRGECLNNEKPA
jgi:predicted site-specific integrase-resolvase